MFIVRVPALLFLLVTVLAATGWAAPRYTFSFELGPEWDSNALRVDDNDRVARVGTALLRATAGGALSHAVARHRFRLFARGGGKLFLRDAARLADEIVVQTQAQWATLLSRWGVLSVQGRYYDAFQRHTSDALLALTRRDFRRGSGVVGLALRRGNRRTVPTIRLGYQGLQFKQDPAFSYHGPLLGVGLRHRFSSGRGAGRIDWSLRASYGFALRAYNAQALSPPGASADQRRDLEHIGRLEGRYLGLADLRLWYALEFNGSNSFGQQFWRHVLGLKFTSELMWGLFLSATGVFQLSGFSDPLFGGGTTQTFDIDEENRSRVLVYLARDIATHWTIGVRYAVYVNESATTSEGVSSPGFLRHTVFMALRFEYDSAE